MFNVSGSENWIGFLSLKPIKLVELEEEKANNNRIYAAIIELSLLLLLDISFPVNVVNLIGKLIEFKLQEDKLNLPHL